ncbi:hypothetical protein L484_024393 [Morus notabilis]|uniref:Uncharacterized protein n=1 Tax=Morus notabilis TaxID=981085 RepID=W9RX73_9ROSA|nr:hypothetical protein L484_024393 [Morus notabilis]
MNSYEETFKNEDMSSLSQIQSSRDEKKGGQCPACFRIPQKLLRRLSPNRANSRAFAGKLWEPEPPQAMSSSFSSP